MTEQQNDAIKRRPLMWYVAHGARILLGLLFFVFGMMGLLNLLPKGGNMPDRAMAFFTAIMNTHYLFQFIKGTEAFAGLLLLSNRFVPLAIVVIAPVVANIVAFHAFLAPSGVVAAIVILGLEVFLAICYRRSFQPLFQGRATPVAN